MRPKMILIPLVGAVVIGGAIVAYRANSKKPEPEKSVQAAPALARGPAQAGVVILDEATQKRIDLGTETLVSTNWHRELKGYGRVLDPAPLSALATELASAQIAAAGSRQELARLKVLKENASEKAVQLAEGAFRRDEFGVQAVQAKLKLTWGNTIAAQENLPDYLQPFISGQKILVRISLAAGDAIPSNPSGATLTSLAGAKPLEAKFLEALPQMDEQTQGQSFLFLADSRSDFRIGAAVTGLIPVAGETVGGVLVPRAAVVRHEGKTWVYFKADADHFVRREMKLEVPTEGGWISSTPLTNPVVVVRGAQILLSEESKDRIQ